jgi:hypothetical protein
MMRRFDSEGATAHVSRAVASMWAPSSLAYTSFNSDFVHA